MSRSGILYSRQDAPEGPERIEAIPLEEVKVRIHIVDVTARVVLTQKFYNASPTPTGRAKYCFPVPASAAICAFQMMSSDGRVMRGECKEKSLAREQYESAIASGKMAGLLDYVTDDIFVISVGSFPPHTVVETQLVYVMTLYTGDYMDQMRFQLPRYVGQRYGSVPPELTSSVQPSSMNTRIFVTAEIQMSGRLQHITSPSHHISETRYLTRVGRSSRRRTSIRYSSQTYLDRDFILMIHASDLDEPRCFVEVRRDGQQKLPDTVALQLTMVPRNKLPPLPSQEYIFIVDRSGSMEGDNRIQTAKDILVMMLHMIPGQHSTFNIFGFGNNCQSWHPRSQGYSQQSLEDATRHVDSFHANMGGTEICHALKQVFSTCTAGLPTVIFLMTDGDVYDQEVSNTRIEVEQFVRNSTAPRRLFTLGIGNGVSTHLCETIARAGNGECLLAVDTESITQKCAQLFTAGRTPFIRNIAIDWGTNISSPEVTFSNHPSPRTVPTGPLPGLQQAPHRINAIHAGTRLNIFAIATSKSLRTPKEVILSGTLDDETQRSFRLEVPVQRVDLVDIDEDLPLIHTMAGWRLIQEHGEKRAPIPQPIGVSTEEELRQSVIVQLGVQYQIASLYTSFVAVEGDRDGRSGRRMKQSFISSYPEHDNPDEIQGSNESINEPRGVVSTVWRRVASTAFNIFGFLAVPSLQMNPNQTGESRNFPPGSWPEEHDIGPDGVTSGGVGDEEDGSTPGSTDSESSSVRTFSTLSSLEQDTFSSDWSSTSSEYADNDPIPSPRFEPRPLDPNLPQPNIGKSHSGVAPVSTSVVDLVKLQKFDGSFSNSDAIKAIVGASAIEEGNNLRSEEQAVWATILCVAYLKKHLQGNPELLDNLLVKPLEFLRRKRNLDVERLLERAATLL